jgi:hypothetical protein
MKTKLVFVLSTLSMLFLISSCCSLCKNASLACSPEGVGLISDSTSRVLANNYKLSIADQKDFGEGSSDSRSVWFSYEEMAKYLCILKNEYEKRPEYNGDTDLSKLGIRIYFGKYPEQRDLNDIDDLRDIFRRNEYANYNRTSTGQPIIRYGEKKCVFFVPTYEVKDTIKGIYQQDFMLDRLISIKGAPSGILLPGINKNHGALAPPEKIEGAIYLQNNQQSH